MFIAAPVQRINHDLVGGPAQTAPTDPMMFTNTSLRVEQQLSSMSLREKIAQMIVTRSDGFDLDESSAEFNRLKTLVTEDRIGGVIFFKGNSIQEARLINKLQSLSETPLLMSSDFERGTRMRLEDGSLYPSNMALGATRDPELAYKMGFEIAKECRAIGIHQNYAPVMDVNNNSLNPIINVRSYGEDPELVSEMGLQYIKGLQDGNVIATAKHFPGHGDTDIDSHSDLPVLNFDMSRLDSVELYPFRKAVKSGVMSVMVAHLSFPVVDNDPFVPASLSKKIIEGLLLENLDFKGLVVTDALNMEGVIKHFSTEEVAVRCADAGVDLILMPQGERRTIDAIESAVADGRVSEEKINASVRKILNAKEWLKISERKFSSEEEVRNAVNSENAKSLARQIAERSLTLVSNDSDLLPLKSQQGKKCLVISLNNGNEKANSDYFLKLFKDKNQFDEYSYYDLTGDIVNAESIIQDAKNYDLIVIPVYAKVKIKTGTVGLPSTQLDLINALAKSVKLSVISFGNPYLIQGFPGITSYVCAYSDSEASIEASVDALFGNTTFKGKLPVTISDEFRYGHGITN
jgi:beta-glucosidase-like glycosyl hydrolase